MADAPTGSGRPRGGAESAATGDSGAGKKPPEAKTAEKAAAKPAKAAPAKKATAKKATAKKATAKKATAKKATAKKATAKKATAKKATAKKAAPAEKTAAKSAAPKAPTGQEALQPAEAPDALPPDEASSPRSFPPPDDVVQRDWVESYPPLIPQTYPYPDVALTRLLDDAAKDFPDSVATEFAGRTLTYRRILDQVDRFATALEALGVRKGDRVGLALPNCPQHVIAFFAVLRLGAVAVEHDPTADEDVLGFEIDTAGARVLVIADPVYAKVVNLKGRLRTLEHVIGTALGDYLPPLAATAFSWRHRKDAKTVYKIPPEEGVWRFTELIRRHPPIATQAPVAPGEDLAMLAFQQDTRERRAVMLTHRNLLANIFQIRLWIPDVQAGRETVLCTSPFWEPYGLIVGLGLAVLSAATTCLVPDFHREALLPVMDKRKPTILPATSTMIEAIASAPNVRKFDLSSLRVCLCVGTVLQPDVAKTFEGLTGGRVREALGIIEAAAITHANPVYGKAKAERVGLPITDTVCALVDPDDHSALVAPGTAGELAVSGPQVMKGYWERPEDTNKVLRDGWLLTGYLAEVDDDGYFAILGRVDSRATPSGGPASGG